MSLIDTVADTFSPYTYKFDQFFKPYADSKDFFKTLTKPLVAPIELLAMGILAFSGAVLLGVLGMAYTPLHLGSLSFVVAGVLAFASACVAPFIAAVELISRTTATVLDCVMPAAAVPNIG